MAPLLTIYRDIASRAAAVETAVSQWPCRAGCDHCCRHLHRVPEATRAEWQYFEQGLAGLPSTTREAVRGRIARLADNAPRGHVVCPALDSEHGRCLVYEHRPAACRSYGYYRSRGHDNWCSLVEAHVEASANADAVVFGNEQGLQSQLRSRFGEAVSMTTWFAEREP